ncbi:Ig-like domain-containing protein [Moheibacter sediminis]|uniref:Gliding motility-associated C-terminal domain-containing protein n=1 Tax=Moheibacter sediminis TaxID=1434700 RepID=A0A1W2CH80_9FLAO|nr:T9SS type B sorting domain-containing protein [Moheibacter sediminis]SMC84540.1 gliding motility-associated C-terminal domain-containing protein [Moheibacter sediminis]
MKYLCNIFFLFVVSVSLNAQLQKAYWYFGYNVGLDFTSGNPAIDTNGMVETMEGCTSISDEYGNLLFYSDGQKVYDRTHNIMQNGQGLNGHSSSTSSAVILPKPNDCNLYYLFTIDARERRQKGIQYNIIDMSLNGGMGAVLEKNIEIPINGIQQGYEKLAAISNSDKTGYWIVTHFEGNFYAFSIDEHGIDLNPIISPSTIGSEKFIGYLKASPDGSKLGMGMFSSANNENAGYLSVYDFDTETGIVSNETILYEPTTTPGNYYGIEFSPNGNLLYATNIILGNTLKVYIEQYNLTAPSIINSKYIVSLNAHYGALQLALDGKIYNSGHQDSSSKYIGAIKNPDVAYNPGTGEVPSYDRKYIDLSPYITQMTPSFGLPTFLNNYFRVSINVNGLSIDEEQLYCSGNTLDFNYCYQGGEIESVHWNFGDGQESTEMYPQHNYSEPGTYTVTLTLIVDGEEHIRTFEITITGPPNVEQMSDLEVCLDEGESYTFNLDEINVGNASDIVTFHLSQEEAENNENPQTAYTTDETTTIWVRIEDENGCFVLRTFDLIINNTPEFSIDEMVEICLGNSITIEVQTAVENTVKWYNGEFDEIPFFVGMSYTTPELNQTTTYWIEAQAGECISERQRLIIMVNQLPTIESLAADPVCIGSSSELSVATNGITVNWYENEFDTNPVFTGNPFITPPLNSSVTFYAEAVSTENCNSERIPVEAFVIDEIIPQFEQIEPVCYGQEFTLPNQSINGITGNWTPVANNTVTTTYTFHPDEELCSTQEITMTIEVVETPELYLPEEEIISCVAQPVTITVSSTGEIINWYTSEFSGSPIHTGNTYSIELTVTTTFWLESQTGSCTSERKPITVTVYPTPEMQELEDILICEGTSYEFTAPEGFDYYEWTDQYGNIISTGPNIVFTEEGLYKLIAGINAIPCPIFRDLEVSFSTAPAITEIKTTENTLTISVSGNGPFEYSLNNIFWQSSPVFTNLQSGIYYVYVRDIKGCGSSSKQAGIIGVPNFISPNGDGRNDTWQIRGIEAYPNSRLQIFDRYGKQFVDKVLQTNYEWDGKYNGQSLPSGSYWYILTLENGDRISGHINLRN